MLSLLLLQVRGIITLVEEEGGLFPAPWKNSVFVSPQMRSLHSRRVSYEDPGSCPLNGRRGRGEDVSQSLLPIRAGFLLLPFPDMPE